MSAITDKLDAEWAELTTDKDMFEVRATIQDFYNNLVRTISDGQKKYPTGDAAFDAYVQPIVAELISFKNGLETKYADFINWVQ